jgi:lipopolysaccharide transport system permease protein
MCVSVELTTPVKIIEPGRGSLLRAFTECWCARELLYFLAWRDIKIRYKQTILGASWAVIQPFAQMVIFTLIFNRVAGLKAPDGVPYTVFTFAALLPWQLFQNSLSRSSASVVSESNLLTKVYFPRLLVPLSSVVSGLLDFFISFVILIAMMAYFGYRPGWTIVTLPFFIFLSMLTALSVGLWLAALNVKYRDFRYIVPFMLTIWMFISPVAYPASAVMGKIPAGWAWVYNLNPMVMVVEGFRWAILGKSGIDPWMLLATAALVAFVFWGGLLFFRKTERVFADLL